MAPGQLKKLILRSAVSAFPALIALQIHLLSLCLSAQPTTLNWAFSLGSSGIESSPIIRMDSSGIIVAGIFTDTLDFDPGPGDHTLAPMAGLSIFFGRYTSNGQLVWVKTIHDPNQLTGLDIKDFAIDHSGNICMVGSFTGSVDFDPSPSLAFLTASVMGDAFLAKYSASGNYLWAMAIGGNGKDQGHSLEIDALNNIVLAGNFEDTVDFDPSANVFNVISSFPGENLFMAKYTSSGAYEGAWSIQGTTVNGATVTCNELVIDNQGNIYMAGLFEGSTDFDPSLGQMILSPNSFNWTDGFLVKYDSLSQLSKIILDRPCWCRLSIS